jgi:DMSO/TMAO reductase YedYZ molybdopterin-dependent catalytic subunit
MEDNQKLERIIEARMKLRHRFEEQMRNTPSVADNRPLGKGQPNRHGMPVVPIGQTITQKWPVLDLGIHPKIEPKDWRLRLDGDVENPLTLTWEDFMALEQVEDTSDFHCVTTWSKLNIPWVGVRFMDLAALVQPKETATHVLCHAYDDYTTNLSLAEALKPDVLLVHQAEGKLLPREHGGPIRMITPQLYAW